MTLSLNDLHDLVEKFPHTNIERAVNELILKRSSYDSLSRDLRSAEREIDRLRALCLKHIPKENINDVCLAAGDVSKFGQLMNPTVAWRRLWRKDEEEPDRE